MSRLLLVSVLWLASLALMSQAAVPRRSVPYHRDNAYFFKEEGVSNYSTMLLREDLGLLVLGAREAVYALDLHNIAHKSSSVKWHATQEQRKICGTKGRDPETECKNYIKMLHETSDGKMFVCGTNAFEPMCDYMAFVDGKLVLENRQESGRGKCPFNPLERHASILDENDLYSATAQNFMGTMMALRRGSLVSSHVMKTNDLSTFKDPTFVSMIRVPESQDSKQGDDDKIYLFFSETAIESNFFHPVTVSRVARVCKGDMGGTRLLVKKWATYLKIRLDCPVPNSKLPYVVQDTHLWCDPGRSWRECLLYAIFTPQSDTSHVSAVCVYVMEDISRVFAEEKFMTATNDQGYQFWRTHSGEVPTPRPGACIDDSARASGIRQTVDLPDRTLDFAKYNPLMASAILPTRGIMAHRGATFVSMVVNQVQAADGDNYHVMFIGTDQGSILKAVSYDGEMFIIEEVQLFKSPIKILKFSNITGQLYAGSDDGAAQMPLATCERSVTCMDCVLARDPYCGWDSTAGKCAALSNAQGELIQSVSNGHASLCPAADPMKPVDQQLWLGGDLKLHCRPLSNLAKTVWEKDSRPLIPSPRHQFIQDGLLVLNALPSDAGLYHCLSVERSKGADFVAPVVEYLIGAPQAPLEKNSSDSGDPTVIPLQATVGVLVFLLMALISWNFYKGWNCRDGCKLEPQGDQRTHCSTMVHHDAGQSRSPVVINMGVATHWGSTG